MSGKKLRQRAFAWFMAIAMVLTNITISPLTGMVSRAATITPNSVAITSTGALQPAENTSTTTDKDTGVRIKLTADIPVGTVSADGILADTKMTVAWKINGNATNDVLKIEPVTANTGGYTAAQLKSGVEYKVSINKKASPEDAGVKLASGTEYAFKPVISATVGGYDHTVADIAAKTLTVRKNIEFVEVTGYTAGTGKLSGVSFGPVSGDEAVWHTVDSVRWFDGKGTSNPITDLNQTIAANHIYTAQFVMLRESSDIEFAADLGTVAEKETKPQISVKDGSGNVLGRTTSTYLDSEASTSYIQRTVTVEFNTTAKDVVSEIVVNIPGKAVTDGAIPKELVVGTAEEPAVGYTAELVKWQKDGEDISATETTFLPNKVYKAFIKVKPTENFKLSKSDADPAADYDGTITVTAGTGEDSTSMSASDKAWAALPSGVKDNTLKELTFTVTFGATDKTAFGPADLKLLGVENGVAYEAAAIKLEYADGVTVAQKATYDKAIVGWYPTAGTSLSDDGKTVAALGTKVSAGTLDGGASYWLVLSVTPTAVAGADLEVQKTSVINVNYNGQTLKAYPVDALDDTWADDNKHFAVKIDVPKAAISKATITIDTGDNKFRLPSSIAGALNATAIDGLLDLASGEENYTILKSTVPNIKTPDKPSLVPTKTANAGKLVPGDTYTLTFTIAPNPTTYAFSEDIKAAGNVKVKLGTAAKAPEYNAVYVRDGYTQGTYTFKVEGLKVPDYRQMKETFVDATTPSTDAGDAIEVRVAEDNADVPVRVALADDMGDFYATDKIVWSVVDSKGVKAPGVTVTADESVIGKAVLSFGDGLVAGTYTIKAALSGDAAAANLKRAASRTLTVLKANATAEITGSKTIFEKPVVVPGTTPDPETIDLTFAITNDSTDVLPTANVSWSISPADGNLEILADGKNSGSGSWVTTLTVPYNATAKDYTVKAEVPVIDTPAGSYTATSNKVVAEYKISVVENGKKASVSSVAIETVNGKAYETGNESYVSSVYYVSSGDSIIVNAKAVSNDMSAVSYKWELEGTVKADGITIENETTDTVTLKTTKGKIKDSVTLKVSAVSNEEDNAKEATLSINVVDYKLGYYEGGSSTNYKAFGDSKKFMQTGTDQQLTFALFNGNVVTAGTGALTTAVTKVESGKYDDITNLSSSTVASNTLTINGYTGTGSTSTKLSVNRNIVIASKLNGITVRGNIEVGYDWKHVTEVVVTDKTFNKSDSTVKQLSDVYITKAVASTSGLVMYGKAFNEFVSLKEDAGATEATGWEWSRGKQENITIENSTTATATAKMTETGDYTVTVKAKNADNVDLLKDSVIDVDNRWSDITTITIHVIDYDLLSDEEGKVDNVYLQKAESGATKAGFSVKALVEDAYEDIKESVTWSLANQAITPALEGDAAAQKKIIDAVFSISDGVLSVDTAAEATPERTKWVTDVVASIGTAEVGRITVTITKDGTKTTSVSTAVTAGVTENNAVDKPYILGVGENGVLKADITVLPAEATDKSVSTLVVKSGTKAEDLQKPESAAAGVSAVVNPENRKELLVTGAEKGEYDVYVYSTRTENGNPVYSTAIKVKVVDYRLFMYNKDSKEQTEDKKYEQVEGDVIIPVEGNATLQLRNLEVTKAAADDKPEETGYVVPDGTLTIEPFVDEESGIDWTGYASAVAGVVTVHKYSASPIVMKATLNGQVILFNIVSQPAALNVVAVTYAGDGRLMALESMKALEGDLDLNSTKAGDDFFTVDFVVKPTNGKDLKEKNSTLVDVEYYINGVQVPLQTIKDEKIAEIYNLQETAKSAAGNGKSGYHNIYVVKMLKPVDLKLAASAVAAAADDTAAQADTSVLGKKMSIYVQGEAGEVPVEEDYSIAALDRAEFVLKNGQYKAIAGEEIAFEYVTEPVAGEVEWTTTPDKAAEIVKSGATAKVTNNVKTNIVDTEMTLAAKSGGVTIERTIKLEKYIPVASITIEGESNIIRGSEKYPFTITLKGADGKSVPTETAYAVVADASLMVADDEEGNLQVRGKKATPAAVKITVTSEYGAVGADGKQAEVKGEILVNVWDIVPAYVQNGSDVAIDGYIDMVVGDNLTLRALNGSKAMENVQWVSKSEASIEVKGSVITAKAASDGIAEVWGYVTAPSGKVLPAIKVQVNVITEEESSKVVVKNGDTVLRKTGGAVSVDLSDSANITVSGKEGVTIKSFATSDASIATVKDGKVVFTGGTGAVNITVTFSDGTQEVISLYVTDLTNSTGKNGVSISATDITLNPYLDFENSANRAMIISYEGTASDVLSTEDIKFEGTANKNGVIAPANAVLAQILEAKLDETHLTDYSAEQFIKIGVKDGDYDEKTLSALKNGSVDVVVDMSSFGRETRERFTIKVKFQKTKPSFTVKQTNVHNTDLKNDVMFEVSGIKTLTNNVVNAVELQPAKDAIYTLVDGTLEDYNSGYTFSVPDDVSKYFSKGQKVEAKVYFDGYRVPFSKTVGFKKSDFSKVRMSSTKGNIPAVNAEVSISGITLRDNGGIVDLDNYEVTTDNENVEAEVYDDIIRLTFNPANLGDKTNVAIMVGGASTKNLVYTLTKVSRPVKLNFSKNDVKLGLKAQDVNYVSFANLAIDMPLDEDVLSITSVTGVEMEAGGGTIALKAGDTEVKKTPVTVTASIGGIVVANGKFNVEVRANARTNTMNAKGSFNVLGRNNAVKVTFQIKGSTDEYAEVSFNDEMSNPVDANDVPVFTLYDETALAVNKGNGTFEFYVGLNPEAAISVKDVNGKALYFKVKLGDDEFDAQIKAVKVVQRKPKMTITTDPNVDAFSKREFGARQIIQLGNMDDEITAVYIDRSKDKKNIFGDFYVAQDENGNWTVLLYNNRGGSTQVKKSYNIPLIIETANQDVNGKYTADYEDIIPGTSQVAVKSSQLKMNYKILIVQ